MITCLMPTYNRCPDNKYLIDESLESFLLQDYEDKELIICNDTPKQELNFSHEGVRVFNLPERFPTLSDKDFLLPQGKISGYSVFSSFLTSLPS